MRILISLSSNRKLTGSIHAEDERNQVILGPFAIGGCADSEIAAQSGNAGLSTLLPYGHTPLGQYKVLSLISGELIKDHSAYGANAILLEGLSGDIVEATRNGRGLTAIHGGDTDSEGFLLPTNGSLRMFNEDIESLCDLVRASAGDPASTSQAELDVRIDEDMIYFEDEIGEDHGGDPPMLMRDRSYWVQDGDTLSEIAEIFYGSASMYQLLADANASIIRNPDLIYPGDQLSIPNANYPLKYTLRVGDTLTSIANRFYGGEEYVDLLFESNRDKLDDPDVIYAGQDLLVP